MAIFKRNLDLTISRALEIDVTARAQAYVTTFSTLISSSLVMASYREWLHEGKDLAAIELIGWVLIVSGVNVFLLNVFKLNIPYGRYGNDKSGPFVWLGLTSFKLPAKLAWFVMELPSFLIPVFLILNVGGKYVGEFNPNIFLLGMFILHYFNR